MPDGGPLSDRRDSPPSTVNGTAVRSSASGHRVFWLLCALGLAVRILGMPSWGTFDVEVQKAWALRAASSLADIYGPSDREVLARARAGPGVFALLTGEMPFPRTEFTWGSGRYFVDYPPGSLLVLGLEGRLYRAFRPDAPNKPLLNAAVNVAPLLASVAIALLLYRSGQRPAVRSLAFWLNPAVVFAAPYLGYPDPLFAALALGAVQALARDRLSFAAGLGTAAALIKPQGVLLAPVIFGILARRGDARSWLRAVGAGACAAGLILAPWVVGGHLLSALDGFRRPFGQATLAPLGLNVWWIAGWIADRVTATGPIIARIWTIDAFAAVAGFDPRIPARVLVMAAAALVFVWTWRRHPTGEGPLALAVVVIVHTYALFATSVHENHTFLAVAAAPLLLRGVPWSRLVLFATSAFLGASLFFAAGLGRRVTRLRTIEDLRSTAFVDPTILVAVLHVLFVAFLWRLLWNITKGPRSAGDSPWSPDGP